jgi:hypothetical protein
MYNSPCLTSEISKEKKKTIVAAVILWANGDWK